MKKIFLSVIMCVFFIAPLIIGCQPAQSSPQVDISCDEFMSQKNIAKNINVSSGGSLAVSLCSNASTGFQWGEAAVISQTSVIKQKSHTSLGPPAQNEPVVGAPGKEVWMFDVVGKGTSTITFSYGRPWEGGEKGEWTLTLNVTAQ